MIRSLISGFNISGKNANTWNLVTSPTTEYIYNVMYANNTFVATTMSSIRSSDGVTWQLTGHYPSAPSGFYGLAYGAGLWVAGTNGGSSTYRIFTSSDNGITWNGINSPFVSGDYIYSIAYGNGVFVAQGGSSTFKIATSIDGVSWTNRSNQITSIGVVSFANGKFFLVSGSNTCYSSTNGITWSSSSAIPSQSPVVYGNGVYVMLGYSTNNGVATSTDGVTWTTRSTALTSAGFGTNISMKNLTYAEGIFVAVGFNGSVATSIDGVTWTKKTSANFSTSQLYGITYANNRFIITGGSGKILSSLN